MPKSNSSFHTNETCNLRHTKTRANFKSPKLDIKFIHWDIHIEIQRGFENHKCDEKSECMVDDVYEVNEAFRNARDFLGSVKPKLKQFDE